MDVSFELIVALIKGRQIVEFCGTTFIKGFSAMLAAVAKESGTIFWHLYFNEDGSYISYEDPRVPRASGSAINILHGSDLDRQQHIVGWCVAMKNYTGAHDANYSIGWSGLGRPGSHCAFEKVSISAGKYITAAATVAIGIKDRPVHIAPGNDYVRMLLNISERHFVFYDIVDRRAWLVDGASGLLHLLRASIRNFQDDRRLRILLCYDQDALEEANEPYTGLNAAFDVLSNMNNRALHLYHKSTESWHERTIKLGTNKAEDVQKEKTTFFCLEERVEQLCHLLGQITAHQDDISTESGVGFKVRLSPRHQLEGFDFMDAATGQSTLWPKMVTLSAKGAGWVDFTRSIHAVTFFGTGFGQLFAPTATAGDKGVACGICMWNGELPKGRDYLAATVPDIKEILKKKGSTRTNPWCLADKIYWHTPDKLFEPCNCSPSGAGCESGPSRDPVLHDRVQVLLPATFPKLLVRGFRSPTMCSLPAKGAVIFGHSSKFPLLWRSRGDPACEEGDTEELGGLEEAPFHDSGLEVGNTPVASSSPSPPSIYPGEGTPSPTSNLTPSLYSQSNSRFVSYGGSTAGPSSVALDKGKQKVVRTVYR